jgi:peptidoglycan/LPS O-acetylase OafA/YrhL
MLKYRPEIDGLRTIAVLSVLIYHAEIFISGHQLLRGGFLGVDIFFVISGYLITSIVLKEINGEGFSYARFYERRARRLLPALIVVLIVTTAGAVLILGPSALMEYAGSVVSSLFFTSNIWFWLQDAYTAEPSRLKPLLHTWTLSVEEQFYIFFPIVVMLVVKFRKDYLLPILVMIFLASLQWAQISAEHFPEANFYLIPMRAWELMAGALLAKLDIDYGRKSHPALTSTMPMLGLGLIIGPMVLFHHGVPHPSYYTLIPVVGTVLILRFARPGELVTDFLSSKLMVWGGLISYSLYLWHYPLFALARVQFGALSLTLTLALLMLSVLLAVMSYRWVETPFRNPQKTPLKRFAALCGVFVVLLLIASASIFKLDGRVRVWEETAFEYTQEQIDAGRNARFDILGARCSRVGWDVCNDPLPDAQNILIVGDSHAPDALNALDVVFPEAHLMQSTLAGCPPSDDIRALVLPTHPNLTDCEAINRERFDPSNLEQVDMVVINYLAAWYGPDELEPYLQFLTENTDAPILLFGNYIHYNANMPELLMSPDGLAALEEHTQSRFLYEDENRALAERYGIIYVSKKEALCTGEECPLFAAGQPFTWDRHHLSLPFARLLGEAIADDVRPLLNE